MTALTLDLSSVICLTHKQFELEQLALANRDLHPELTAAGDLVPMPPREETQAAATAT